MKPYDYGNCATTYKQEVDLSVAGMVQDCAECHVGGGAMQYVPAPTIGGRTELRDLTPAGTTVNTYWVDSGNYTAFNYFIDTYDVDGDTDKLEVLPMDWSTTGVMEMDCLLCHLEGYDYDARIAMLRDAKFDASRAVGAGVAAPNTADWGDTYYGTKVTYNNLVEDANTTGSTNAGNATFNSAVLTSIKASPPSENCGFCHFNMPGVDWKKRGDNWKKDVDAHWVVQCMGCHAGKVGTTIGTSGSVSSSDLGQCDPARGNAPYSSVWKPTKNTIKTCDDCHLRAGYDSGLDTYSPDYGAPDPTGKHQAYGLLGKICQNGTDGKVDASHLDIIDCAACHVRKIATGPWNTGGAVVDASGPDHDGRLADHENDYVYRDMQENLCYTWQGTKIIPSSVLTTIFWRDKDDVAGDVNNDGLIDGMDTPLMTHVLGIDMYNNATTMSEDNLGIIDSTVIAERISWLTSDLDSYLGTTNSFVIKLCSMAVPFKVTHNVSPATYALGHSCNDCHNATAGIFNGPYALQGKHMDLSYDAAQVTPLTWVNAKEATTDFHPNTKNKGATRSIACKPFSGGSDNLTAIDRSEILYETTFSTRNKAWTTGSANITSVAIDFSVPSKLKGLALAIEATNATATSANVTRIKKVGSAVATVGALITDLGTFADGSLFEFEVKDDGGNATRIVPKAGYKIRISPSTSTKGLGLINEVWTAKSVKGVDQNTYATRALWVAYLNGITDPGRTYPDANVTVSSNSTAGYAHGYGIGCDAGNATYCYDNGIDDASCNCTMVWKMWDVVIFNSLTFTADDVGPGAVYMWDWNDGTGRETGNPKTHTFNSLGVKKVTLTVVDAWGIADPEMVLINVKRP